MRSLQNGWGRLLAPVFFLLVAVRPGVCADGQYLQSYVQIIKNIKEQLNKLQQSGAIQGEDVAFMAKVVDTYDLLGAEANAFQSYLTSGGQANIDVYDSKRKAAWKNIQGILGINE